MKTEKILSIIFLIGLIFKLNNWPASSIILIIPLITLAVIYFFGAFYFFADKTIKRSNIALSIISGIFVSIIPIGILFKLQIWVGGEMYLYYGIISGVIVLSITLVLSFINKKSDLKSYFKLMIIRTLILTILSFVFLKVSSKNIIRIQHRSNPEFAEIKIKYLLEPDGEKYKDEYFKHLNIVE